MTSAYSEHGLLNSNTRFPRLEYVVFDLEATLFWSDGFKSLMLAKATSAISAHLGLSEDQAQSMLKSRRDALAASLGYTPALSTTVLSFGVPLGHWARAQSTIALVDSVPVYPNLPGLLAKLAATHRVIVYTNMCADVSDAVLTHLGVRSSVHSLFSLQAFGIAKPNPEAIQQLVSRGVLVPALTVAVGDRYHLDIAPIIAVGGYGYLVDSFSELEDFLAHAIHSSEA
jgi:FMN phosphatase YigB (HAD superfamily)